MPVYNNNNNNSLIRLINNTNNGCYNNSNDRIDSGPAYLVTTELRTPKIETIYCSNNTNNYDMYNTEIAPTSSSNNSASIMLDELNGYGKNMASFKFNVL